MPREARLFHESGGSVIKAYLFMKAGGSANIPPMWVARALKSRESREKEVARTLKKTNGRMKYTKDLVVLEDWEPRYRKVYSLEDLSVRQPKMLVKICGSRALRTRWRVIVHRSHHSNCARIIQRRHEVGVEAGIEKHEVALFGMYFHAILQNPLNSTYILDPADDQFTP